MRTIRDFLNENLQSRAEHRLAKLVEMGAPSPVIETQRKKIASGNFSSKVGKIKQFGDAQFVSFESKKYRRGNGVTFTLSDGSQLFLIPGPYSLFLTNESKGER